jgi:hypothetical protein
MSQSLEDRMTFDVIPLVRTALKETAELTGPSRSSRSGWRS